MNQVEHAMHNLEMLQKMNRNKMEKERAIELIENRDFEVLIKKLSDKELTQLFCFIQYHNFFQLKDQSDTIGNLKLYLCAEITRFEFIRRNIKKLEI